MPTTSRRPSPEVSPQRPPKVHQSRGELCQDRNSDRGNSQEDHSPRPRRRKILAAKFDAHDMMAYYGDPADETPHIKPSRTITGEFGSPPQESSFLARSQPPCVGDEGLLLAIQSRRANHHRGPSRARVYWVAPKR